MPARMISLKYAASNAMKVMTADHSAPKDLPIKNGISKKNHRMTITKGTERMPLTYAVAGNDSSFRPDKRISANTVPKAMPPSVATTVSCTLKTKPFRMNLVSRSQLRNERSSPISGPRPCHPPQ